MICSLGVAIALFSCEKATHDKAEFSDPINPETHQGGVKVTLKSATGTTTAVSKGAGFACDSMSGIATGNSVVFDPLTMSIYTTDPNEIPLVMDWTYPGGTPMLGTFSAGLVSGDFNGKEVMADASMVNVNVTTLTNDSIKGDFYGPVENLKLVIDTVNQTFQVVPTGVIDTISGFFAVERAPCF